LHFEVNAQTAQVGTGTNLSGFPTNQDLARVCEIPHGAVGYFESSVKRSKKNKQERQNEDHSKQNNKRISKNSDNPVASS